MKVLTGTGMTGWDTFAGTDEGGHVLLQRCENAVDNSCARDSVNLAHDSPNPLKSLHKTYRYY